MHELCRGYPYCYSGNFFSPEVPTPPVAPASERAAFWLGAAATIAAAPITLPLASYYKKLIRREKIYTLGTAEKGGGAPRARL